ncbi:hypothetical protein K502DRAFT_366054 [Neoconidiobolus thromboides FSU 785]|nr:hypothetical protein K502DRAFT_366054 [Neoconidiobolus thromboides FSU 785]
MKIISVALVSILLGIALASNEESIGYRQEAVKEHEPHQGNCSKDEIKNKEDGLCYPKYFKATHEFQKIIEGQIVPPGLHYKMGLQNGEKMAKLLDTAENKGNEVIVLKNKDNNKNTPSLKSGTRTHKENASDRGKFNDSIAQLQNLDADKESITEALENLEELVHDINFGLDLVNSDVFVNLLDLLRPIWPSKLRILSAKVIGSSIQNNNKAHDIVHKFDLPSKLLAYLSFENKKDITPKLLYALSASVRNDDLALEAFHRANGFDVLYNVYQFDLSKSVNTKVLNLIIDLLDPSMKNEHSDEKVKNNDPVESGIIIKWCSLLQTKLTNHIDSDLAYLWSDMLLKFTQSYSNNCIPTSEISKVFKQAQNNRKLDDELKQKLLQLKDWANSS